MPRRLARPFPDGPRGGAGRLRLDRNTQGRDRLVVELAETEEIFTAPQHPYAAALLSAVSEPDPRVRSRRIILEGEVANPASPPEGCYFHPRCPHAIEMCRTQVPAWQEISPAHFVACHRARELQLAGVE